MSYFGGSPRGDMEIVFAGQKHAARKMYIKKTSDY